MKLVSFNVSGSVALGAPDLAEGAAPSGGGVRGNRGSRDHP